MKNSGWSESAGSRDEKRLRKKNAILLAGAKLFNDQGYERTSLDQIAKALNITKRTIYYYVQSKEDILFECNKLGLEFIEEITVKCADKSRNPLDNVEFLIFEYAKWITDDLGASLILINDTFLSVEKREFLRSSKAKLDLELRKMLEEGISDGSIAPHDPRLTASAIFGALNWIPFWNRNSNPVPYEVIAKDYLRLFIDGLRFK